MYIKVVVTFKHFNFLHKFYKEEYKHRDIFNQYDIRIQYKTDTINRIRVYDTSKRLIIDKKEKDINNYFFTELKKTLQIILIVKTQKRRKPNILCQLPNHENVSHCFKDSTHQTCCMLGYQARQYADRTGNPIGALSEKMFQHYFNENPTQSHLTPWCTCIGSQVCTFYKNKFNDGTHIKFVNHKTENIQIYNSNHNNIQEDKLIEPMNYIYHKTPGIY